MISIRLPQDIENRLAIIAKATGRTKTFYVREAILEHLDDLEDAYMAKKVLKDIEHGKEKIYNLEQVEKMLEL